MALPVMIVGKREEAGMAEKPRAKWRIEMEARREADRPRIEAFHAEMKAKRKREAAEREAAYDARMEAVEEKAALEGWAVGSDLLRQFEINLTERDLCREFLARRAEAGNRDDEIPRHESRRLRQQATAMVDSRLAEERGDEARCLDDETLARRIAEIEAQLALHRSEHARRHAPVRVAWAGAFCVRPKGVIR